MKQIILNEKSWHRRLWDYVYSNPPHSICPYFWGLIGAGFFAPFWWVALHLQIIELEIPEPGKRVASILLGLTTIGITLLFIFQMWIILLVIGLCVGIGLGITFLSIILKDYFEDKHESLEIISSFTKSRFEKICPMIEWRV